MLSDRSPALFLIFPCLLFIVFGTSCEKPLPSQIMHTGIEVPLPEPIAFPGEYVLPYYSLSHK